MSSQRSQLPRLLACSAVLVSLFLNACTSASNALPTVSSAPRSARAVPMAIAAPMISRCSQTPESAPRPGQGAFGSPIRRESSGCCPGGSSSDGLCTIYEGGAPSPPPSTPAPSSGSGGNGGTGGTGGGFGGTPIIGGGNPPAPPSPPCNPTCAPQPPHQGSRLQTPGERFAALVAAARAAVGSNDISFISGAEADGIINAANIAAGRAAYATPMFDADYGAAVTTADSALQSAFTGSQMLVRLSNDEGAAGSGQFLTTIGSLQNADGSMMTAEQAASATGLGYIPTYVGINMQLPAGAQTLLGIASGGNPTAIAGSVGGADQIWVNEAASAEGDAAIAGGTAVISWETFVEFAPLLLLDAPRGGTRP